MPGQLAFSFGVQPALGRDDFIVAPCNEVAFRFVESWPDWPSPAGGIYGPAGCGKTHLAAVWSARTQANGVTEADATLERLAAVAGGAAILIDGIDSPAWLATEKREIALLSLFERARGTLLLTGRNPPTEWAAVTGDLRSRFDSLLAFPMWAPDDALLSGLLCKHFADRQLDFSESLVGRVLSCLERTPEAIARFAARADGRALAEKRAIGERLVLELLEEETLPGAR